jgi:hypothetical protein
VILGFLQATATIDQLISDLQAETINNRTPGSRPTGSTIDASKALEDHCKRKAFDDAATVFSKSKMKGNNKLPCGSLKK